MDNQKVSSRYSTIKSFDAHLKHFKNPRFLAYLIKRTQNKWDTAEYYFEDALRIAREIQTPPSMRTKTDRFEVAAIEINNTCNLNCRMCNTNQAIRARALMPPEIFEHLVKRLKASGIQHTAIHTIGEPLLHGQLLRLLEIAERHDLKIWISTNAQFPELLEEILVRHRNVLSSIRFSVDGATERTYESIRLGGKWEKVQKSLEIINRLNAGYPDYEFKLNLHVVVSMANICEIPLFFETFGRYVWPEKIIFSLVTGLSPDSTFFRETFPFENLIVPEVPCIHPFSHLTILVDGRASLCCADFDGELTIGDAMETPLRTLWNSQAAEDIRRQHLQPDQMHLGCCKKCLGPYPFVSYILNDYFHFLWLSNLKLSAEEFGNRSIDLLEMMNQVMARKELSMLPERVESFFKTR